MDKHHQVPIWFFIGTVLLNYGVLIFAGGLYHWVVPLKNPVALSYLHADIWWGLLLTAIGSVYCLRFYPRRTP